MVLLNTFQGLCCSGHLSEPMGCWRRRERGKGLREGAEKMEGCSGCGNWEVVRKFDNVLLAFWRRKNIYVEASSFCLFLLISAYFCIFLSFLPFLPLFDLFWPFLTVMPVMPVINIFLNKISVRAWFTEPIINLAWKEFTQMTTFTILTNKWKDWSVYEE